MVRCATLPEHFYEDQQYYRQACSHPLQASAQLIEFQVGGEFGTMSGLVSLCALGLVHGPEVWRAYLYPSEPSVRRVSITLREPKTPACLLVVFLCCPASCVLCTGFPVKCYVQPGLS